MKNFCATGRQRVRLIIAQVVQKFRFGGGMRVGGVNTVDVGVDDELFGVDDVRDDGTGKIGAVAAEGGDAAVGSGADKAGDDGYKRGFDKREKNVAAALFGFFEVRLGVTEGVAGKDEIRGSDRDGGDAGFFERGGEETRAESFAEGSETIGEFFGGDDGTLLGNLVEKIAAEKLKAAADAVVLLFGKLEILKDTEMEMDEPFGFITRESELSFSKRMRNGEETIGDTLHGGDHDDEASILRGGANQTRGVQHALRAEERAAAKLQGDDRLARACVWRACGDREALP
jgi:hypothetical protein